MSKGKREKWEELLGFERVFQPPLQEAIDGKDFELRGRWAEEVFGNTHPVVLELGCGTGEYTVAQARQNPGTNFVGVDIKGHRFWRGARTAHDEVLPNVGFLRTRIEFLPRFFGPEEVSGIWLTFSDPQPKDEKGTRRITSAYFIERYRMFLKPGSLVHVKSDSPLLYERTLESWTEAGLPVHEQSADVYGELVHRVDHELRALLEVKTYYEQMWLAEGRKIHYLRTSV